MLSTAETSPSIICNMSSSSSSTIKSLDVLSTTLPPTAPAQILTRVIVNALLKRGFESAEAGALGDIEKALGHRMSPSRFAVSVLPSQCQTQKIGDQGVGGESEKVY